MHSILERGTLCLQKCLHYTYIIWCTWGLGLPILQEGIHWWFEIYVDTVHQVVKLSSSKGTTAITREYSIRGYCRNTCQVSCLTMDIVCALRCVIVYACIPQVFVKLYFTAQDMMNLFFCQLVVRTWTQASKHCKPFWTRILAPSVKHSCHHDTYHA